MFNVDWSNITESSNSRDVYLYVNFSSFTEPNAISGGGTSGKYIIINFRGRNTNFQRNIIAKPTTGFSSNPQYTHNERYWLVYFKLYYPSANFTPGGGGNVDYFAKRLLGEIVLPCDDTYDIKYYYDDTLSLTLYDGGGSLIVDEIEGVTSVLNVTQSATGLTGGTNPDTSVPIVFYTPYTDNDLTQEKLGAKGLPTDASVDNRDVQYGVQTWTPNYDA
jgi:hypothetical protein|tara:strand:+ start:279 stop:935 length:657 start_codon:yes stop_codon:yes gene_type:complete